ncbi:hypothetical protein [Rhodopseudomonas palustris]|nr:hypothetical protein [Rhodopseudomonas palustris]UYO55705.1 hypothetical protein KQX61_10010 [Rhodopseudomonas palustris]
MTTTVAVALMARNLHTPIDVIEEMDWVVFMAYSQALNVVIKLETPKRS